MGAPYRGEFYKTIAAISEPSEAPLRRSASIPSTFPIRGMDRKRRARAGPFRRRIRPIVSFELYLNVLQGWISLFSPAASRPPLGAAD